MNSYLIPPEDCLVVRALRDSKSLRSAAQYLGCDPSALMRKVRRISSEHDLLSKQNGRWVVTSRGHNILQWTEESILSQRLSLQSQPIVRVAAPTWLAEQVLIPNLAKARKSFGEHVDWSFSIPAAQFEEDLLQGRADFVLSCRPPIDPMISYKKIAPEIWVCIVPNAWLHDLDRRGAQEIYKFLIGKPFVRHQQLNPEALLGSPSLGKIVYLTINHLAGVRSAVRHGLGWSCVPHISILSDLKDGFFSTIPLTVKQKSDVHLWWSRDRKEPKRMAPKFCSWLREILLEV